MLKSIINFSAAFALQILQHPKMHYSISSKYMDQKLRQTRSRILCVTLAYFLLQILIQLAREHLVTGKTGFYTCYLIQAQKCTLVISVQQSLL